MSIDVKSYSMGFIAGHVSKGHRYVDGEFLRAIQSHRIIAADDLNDYESILVETPLGYIAAKHKKDHPIPSKIYCDSNGNKLLVLGFLYSFDGILTATRLETYEGEFIAVFLEQSGNLHIVNDRFGSRPFYISKNSSGIYFSSNLAFLLQMLGRKHDPDVLGWFQVFSYGHTSESRTTFSGVKRLLPATHVTIDPNGAFQERTYWKLEYAPVADLDPVSHSKEVFAAFKRGAVLRSKLAGKGVVALSGGLDSRLVAAALPEDVEFSAFTFVNSAEASSTADTDIAAQVSKVLGLQHRVEPVPRQEYSAIADDVILLTGGMRPLHHSATVMPYIRELERCGVRFLLGGGPGDVSAGSKIPSVRYLDPWRTDECVQDFCRTLAGGAQLLGILFRQEIVEEYRDEVYTSLSESFLEISAPTAAHKVTAWELLNRWPAFTFTSMLHNHPNVSEAFCHLDYQYMNLMLKLPAQWLYERNFYRVMIHNCLPKLRGIPYANTGQLLSSEIQHYDYDLDLRSRTVGFAAQFARKLIPRKIKRLLKPTPKGARSFSYYLYRDDGKLITGLKECLHSISALREILDADKCLRFLDDFRSDNITHLSYDRQTELVGSLATMCLTFKGLSNSELHQRHGT